MDFHPVIAGYPQPARGGDELRLNFMNLAFFQRTHLIIRIRVDPDRWPHRFHVQHGTPQQPSPMIQLTEHMAIMRLDGLDQAGKSGNEAIVVANYGEAGRAP